MKNNGLRERERERKVPSHNNRIYRFPELCNKRNVVSIYFRFDFVQEKNTDFIAYASHFHIFDGKRFGYCQSSRCCSLFFVFHRSSHMKTWRPFIRITCHIFFFFVFENNIQREREKKKSNKNFTKTTTTITVAAATANQMNT